MGVFLFSVCDCFLQASESGRRLREGRKEGRKFQTLYTAWMKKEGDKGVDEVRKRRKKAF